MSNNWRPDNTPGFEKEPPPRTGSLLRDFQRQAQQAGQGQSPQNQPPPRYQEQTAPPLVQNQFSPVAQTNRQAPQPNPQTPFLQQNHQNNQRQLNPQSQQGQLNPQSQQGQLNPLGQQGWGANAMLRVRQWSGKMATMHAQPYGQPEPPMVSRSRSYNPYASQTPLPATPTPQRRQWKRSRTLRVTTQMRRRRDRWSSRGARIGTGILIAVLALLIVITSSTSAYAYSYYQSQLPNVQGLANQHVEQISRMYDRNGLLLGDLYDPNGSGRRTPVQYKDIPRIMQDAMTAAEDKNFWTNSGVDPLAIIRTAGSNLSHQGIQGGASTLTQQLVKNLTHDAQQTTDRKLTEAALAIGLTQQYAKWKIMEMYFNVSPFGTLDLGVEAATEEYFHLDRTCNAAFTVCTPGIAKLELDANGKANPTLGLARAAFLAGMPQSPVSYDPTNGKNSLRRALIRQDEVLHNMLTDGMSIDGLPITEAMIQQAETLTAKMTFQRYKQNIRAPKFFQWVTGQIATKLGHGDTRVGLIELFTGGFNIRTTIDLNLEDYVEKAIDRHINQAEYQPFPFGHYAILSRDNNLHNASAVVMNAKTGEVLAMNGGVEADSGDNNIAVDSYRSPGSTFKPLVYATAFSMGWYPGMVVPDVKTYIPNGGGSDVANAYVPPDYGNVYLGGNNTVRLATANSRNVPAVRAIMYTGVQNVINTARRFGITAIDEDMTIYNRTHKDKCATIVQCTGPALSLGSSGVPLIQMTDAYQVFANQGAHVATQSILDIWDNYGHSLYHYDAAHPHAVQVISPQVAYMMTSVLADEPARAAEFLGDHVLSFNDWDPTYQVHQVAAKTGTTDRFVDNWTMGYTPDVVVGIWAGNSDNSSLVSSVGITGAAPIWHSIIERVSGRVCDPNAPDYDGVPCGTFNPAQYNFTQGVFTVPPGIHKAMTSATDGLKGNGNTDWMLDGEDPTTPGIATAAPVTPVTPGGGTGGTPGTGGGTPGTGGNPPTVGLGTPTP